MQELISLIPDAREIKEYISETQPDEKMLDEWLWEKMFKDRNWIQKEKEQIMNDFKNGCKSQPFLCEEYYNQTYNQYGLDDEARQILNNL